MNNDLEKLDAIRERLDVSYEDARKALEEAGGDVVQALASLENSQRDVVAIIGELVDEIAKLVGSKPAKRIKVRLGRKILADIPVALTAAAGFFLGLTAVLVTKVAIELDKEDSRARSGEISPSE